MPEKPTQCLIVALAVRPILRSSTGMGFSLREVEYPISVPCEDAERSELSRWINVSTPKGTEYLPHQVHL